MTSNITPKFDKKIEKFLIAFGIPTGLYKVITRAYQQLRVMPYDLAELEGGKSKFSGEIKLDEAYFWGRRKGKRGREGSGKSVIFGLLDRKGRMYTKMVEEFSADPLMARTKTSMRKGSVYYTDVFGGSQSLRRWGNHRTLNHKKAFLSKRTINL